MDAGWFIYAGMLLPAVLGLACLLARSPRDLLSVVPAGGVAVAGTWWCAAGIAVFSEPLTAAGGWLRIDALSAWHEAVLGLVFLAGSVFSHEYFGREIEAGRFGAAEARKFGALWFGSAAAMASVLSCNNLGLMWVGIEATTLLTAFLISVHVSALSLEATWKYLLMCSVGVAFAFIGTILVGFAARTAGFDESSMLQWTELSAAAGRLPGPTMKIAFLFLLVGFGTKAGLAPLHSWLPDAHSQAPAPVSALFSGFMLNTGLYCVMRYIPLLEGSPGNRGFATGLMVFFGLASILVAAAFIVFQRDGKRLLAYSSVEHIGIISLGIGLGGLGTFAALWHMLNHATGKSLAFFSIGRLGQEFGTHDLKAMGGAMRRSKVWGTGFFAGVLALIGVAPFSIFMSEFMIIRAAAQSGAFVAMALFLLGAGIVFAGALKHAIAPVWGPEHGSAPQDLHGAPAPGAASAGPAGVFIVVGGLGILLLLGLWMPEPLRIAIEQASGIVGGVR